MKKNEFKDLFSSHASDYAQFRPHYPAALFDYLAGISPARELAWDCGTGNGQAAVQLASRFERVVATDPSEKQLQSATRHPKIEYTVAAAENSPLEPRSADLITVAQAFHWFDQTRFFNEVHRVLKPSGILAFWCYELAQITPAIDQVVLRLYKDTLGPYWEPERRMVEDGYRSVQTPFAQVTPPSFEMHEDWDLKRLVGYLNTWSALRAYLSKNANNPLEELYPALKAAWGDAPTHEVVWPLSVRVCRL